ncbi:EH domain-containing protein 1-like [Lotus japonicus]|uniref:EH domain-containing protein 1-like n=1 Tax=Lotus japonicus TaxID=34305 RepID=UPI00258ECB15|nr:EH domain-containing protein 1-like [Lotus japonicus]
MNGNGAEEEVGIKPVAVQIQNGEKESVICTPVNSRSPPLVLCCPLQTNTHHITSETIQTVIQLRKMKTVSDWIDSCSKEQTNTYHQWFNLADSDGDGRITGNDATKFFALSNLSRSQLKQVWAIADTKRQGFLGLQEFVTAMQLVSLAQAGYDISYDILKTEIDSENIKPPVMEGIDALVAKTKSSTTNSQPDELGTSQPQPSPPSPWVAPKSVKKLPLNAVTSIIDGLKRLYIQKLKPLEVTYRFNDFVSPLLTDSDFDAKPMVMLLGQYSTGKTTFIKHLLRCDYPGAHIGPEPTTDRFVVVMSGPDERSIPGNTVAVDAAMPFSGLTTFGGSFLSKFQCSQMPHPLLDEITFVDTPGVLSGEKQRTQRSYDFTGVISWFAAKCDLILLLFDPHKLDISDEFKRVIGSLRGHDDKIRVVLNKADQIDTQQLMRVYGALMWSLGKVLNTPEVVRVYIGSFNDKPITEGFVGPLGQELFEKEQNDLLADLVDIPRKACDSRINEFVKRARSAKIHAHIISHLRNEMPAIMGKAKAQQRLIDELEDEFKKVQREFHLPAGDFPNVEQFREVLSGYSIDKFEKLKPKMIQAVDDMLGYEIPELLKNFRNPYD